MQEMILFDASQVPHAHQLKKLVLKKKIDAHADWENQLKEDNADFNPADPRICYVFPDNYPDSELPEDKLANSNHRGGLAAFLRPKKLLSKNNGRSIYDIEAIGVPTLSYAKTPEDQAVPLTEKHIIAAFKKIYRKIGEGYIVHIPYNENDEPAFGSGVAANASKEISDNAGQMRVFLLQQFENLNEFLNGGVCPPEYINALNEGKVADRAALNAHVQLAHQQRAQAKSDAKPLEEVDELKIDIKPNTQTKADRSDKTAAQAKSEASLETNKPINLLDIHTIRSIFHDDKKYVITEQPHHYIVTENNSKTKFDIFQDKVHITEGTAEAYKIAIDLAVRLAQKSGLPKDKLVISIRARDDKTLAMIQQVCYQSGVACNPDNPEMKAAMDAPQKSEAKNGSESESKEAPPDLEALKNMLKK